MNHKFYQVKRVAQFNICHNKRCKVPLCGCGFESIPCHIKPLLHYNKNLKTKSLRSVSVIKVPFWQNVMRAKDYLIFLTTIWMVVGLSPSHGKMFGSMNSRSHIVLAGILKDVKIHPITLLYHHF